MWIVRWILIALLILIVLGFALQNQDQTVSVRILKWQSPILPLYLFLYVSFGAGLLFWVLISALNAIKMKGEIFKLNRENRKIRDELNRLRNVTIEDDLDVPDIEEEENRTTVDQ